MPKQYDPISILSNFSVFTKIKLLASFSSTFQQFHFCALYIPDSFCSRLEQS